MLGPPHVSVIIPAYHAGTTLPRVLAALGPQVTPDVEVILVDSSGLGPVARAGLPVARPDWLRVIALPERTLPGRARNLGAETARGRHLVFLDADAVPVPDWLAHLRRAADRGAVAVAGAVLNGTPESAVGTASYLLEFSEFVPVRHGPPSHGASCNLLVERSAFDAADGFREDLWPGEDTVLTVPWARRGELGFSAPGAVHHLNRTTLAALLRHQFRLGRSFAATCDRVDHVYARFSRWPLLPVSPVLRLLALGLRLRHQPQLRTAALRCGPLLVLGLGVWGGGVAAERSRLVGSFGP
jgi:glycosyltransferase involved in cell wall biosynthesis